MMNVESPPISSTAERGLSRSYLVEPSRVEGSSHLLDWYLGRIGTMVEKQGLTSLHWVTGVNTVDVGDRLIDALTDGELDVMSVIGSAGVSTMFGGTVECHIVAAPGDAAAIEPLATLSAARVGRLKDEVPDSFLVVNKSACLDLTPVGVDGGPPEYIDDPAVVELYMGLFTVIANAA